MTRLIPLAEVARALNVSVGHLRHIAADQGRPQSQRRFDAATHERFPQFIRDGNSRRYVVPDNVFRAHVDQRGRVWTPRI